MKYSSSFLGLLIACLLVSSGCKQNCEIPDDPTCRNYDPCWGMDEVSAEFEMWEEMLTDTFAVDGAVFMNRNLILTAQQDHDNYTWYIGNDPNPRSGKTTIVYFGSPFSSVNITLVVEGVTDENCNPGDDGRDTLTKKIQVLSQPYLPIWGTYTGVNTDQPDKPFSIEVKLDTLMFGLNASIRNLPEGCTIARDLTIGANGFYIPGSGGDFDCYGIDGHGSLNASGDSLKIEYRMFDPEAYHLSPPVYTTINKTFIGIKQ